MAFDGPRGPDISPSRIPRTAFAAATVVTAALGFVLEFSGSDGEGSAKLFAASGAFGIIWWTWDLIVDYILGPFGRWSVQILEGGALGYKPPSYGVDDTIRVLEKRLSKGPSRAAGIRAATQLADIYRGVKKDEAKARGVISRLREKYPDSPELATYWDSFARPDSGDREGEEDA